MFVLRHNRRPGVFYYGGGVYQESLRVKVEQEEIQNQSPISDFLNSTNNTRFAAEKVPVKTHHRHHHHRSKRFIPFIVGAVGALAVLVLGGGTVYNTVKGAQLSSQVSEIQKSVSETNQQLRSLEVSVLTSTNITIQLARSFEKSQENLETLRSNVETIVKHVSRLDSFAEAQTRFNLKTHTEHVYERMRNAMRRIEQNDLNLDFVGMTEQNEIFEIAYERLKHSIPSMKESKATFITRMLFAQTIQFFPTDNQSRTNDTTGYYPEHLGNIVFTSFFSILKTNRYDTMQVYELTALPYFIVEKEEGKQLSGLPKMIGLSNNGYIEWQENNDKRVCDFGDYTVCRDPPIIQKRIKNMCLEQLISTDRSFHCQVENSLYSSPYFKKIKSNVVALSTRIPISCAITGGEHIFKNLTIVHVGCNDTFYCENNVNFVGDKRCERIQPYILKTSNDDIIPIIDSIRPLNMSLPKVYPFATDKNLIFTLEEQMRIQQNISKQTEKTSENLLKSDHFSPTRPILILLLVALSVLLLVVVLLIACFLYRCRQNSSTPTSVVNISSNMNQPTQSTASSMGENAGSLYDLLQAFATNKASKI